MHLHLLNFVQHHLACLHLLDLGLLGLHVGSNKELDKEDKQRENVNHVSCSDTGVSAARRNNVGTLGHHGYKLDQLQQGETGLPPNGKRLSGFGVLGVHADKVVGVHDRVDEAIQQDGEVNVSVVKDVNIEPVKEEDGPMMVDVQEGKLAPLFSKNNENCIPEIPNLGGIKEPQEVGHGGIFTVKGDAGHKGAVVAVRQEKGFQGHVRAQHNLRDIVNKLDGVRINGWNASFHNGRADKDKDEVGRRNDKSGTEIRVGPSLWKNGE